MDDVSQTIAGLRRQVRALPQRPLRADAGMNDTIDLEHLDSMAQLADAVREATGQMVRHLRGLGYSWTEIGRALGITKQSAQQRFFPYTA